MSDFKTSLQKQYDISDAQYKFGVLANEQAEKDKARKNKFNYSYLIGKSLFDIYQKDQAFRFQEFKNEKFTNKFNKSDYKYKASESFMDKKWYDPRKLFTPAKDRVEYSDSYKDMFGGNVPEATVTSGPITVNPEAPSEVSDTSSATGSVSPMSLLNTGINIAEIGSDNFSRQDQSYKDATGLQVGLNVLSYVPGLNWLKPVSALIGMSK